MSDIFIKQSVNSHDVNEATVENIYINHDYKYFGSDTVFYNKFMTT